MEPSSVSGSQKKRCLASTGPRASQACRACAASKVRCDDHKTCKRCQKKNITCIRYSHARIEARNRSPSCQPDTGSNKNGTTIQQSPAVRYLPMAQQQQSEQGNVMVDIDHSAPAGLALPDCFDLGEVSPHQLEPVQNMLDQRYGRSLHGQGGPEFDAHRSPSLLEGSPDESTGFQLWCNMAPFDPSMLWGFPEIECDFPSTSLEKPPFQNKAPDLQPQAMTPISQVSPISNTGEVTDKIRNAYMSSLGKWKPEPLDYLTAEEKDLLVDPEAGLDPDWCSRNQYYDDKIFPDQLSVRSRDKILMMVVSLILPAHVSACVSTFPSSECLEKLAKVFLTQHKSEQCTFLHLPTFRPSECDVVLLAACVAAGAVRSANDAVRKYGLALIEVVRRYLSKTSEYSNLLTRKLPYLQAFAIQLQVCLWSGNKRKSEMAGGFSGNLINMLRMAGRFSQSCYEEVTPSVADTGPELEAKWRHWVKDESFKRLVYWLYSHCTEELLLKAVGSPISYAELSITIPASRDIWLAPSATEWKALYLQQQEYASSSRLSLHDCLADPSHFNNIQSLQDLSLAYTTALYTIFAMIHEERQYRIALGWASFTSGKFDTMEEGNHGRHTLRLMAEMRSVWEIRRIKAEPKWPILIELQHMHINAPFHQMEELLGKEGPCVVQKAYTILCKWQQTSSARRAVWHAGQVIRSIRSSAALKADIYVVAAYQAGLCLWTYGHLSREGSTHSPMVSERMTEASKSPQATVQTLEGSIERGGAHQVAIDGPETLDSQRWLSYCQGIPVIQIQNASLSKAGTDTENLAPHFLNLSAVDQVMQEIIDMLVTRFGGGRYFIPILANVCALLQALGRHEV